MASAPAVAPAASLKRIKQELKEWEHTFRRLHGRSPSKDDIKASPSIRALYRRYACLKVTVETLPSEPAENCCPSMDAIKGSHIDYSNLVSVRPTSPATESSDSSQGSHISATPPRKKSFIHTKVESLPMKTYRDPYRIHQKASEVCRPILGDISTNSAASKMLHAEVALSGASKQLAGNPLACNTMNRANDKVNSNTKLSEETLRLGFTIRMQRYGERDKENFEVEHIPAGFCLNRIASSQIRKPLSHRAFARAPNVCGATNATDGATETQAPENGLSFDTENKKRSPVDSEINGAASTKKHRSSSGFEELGTVREMGLKNLPKLTVSKPKSLITDTGLLSKSVNSQLDQANLESVNVGDMAETKGDRSEDLSLGGAVSQECLEGKTVATLRELLSLNGLPVGGKKATLIARVLEEAKNSANVKIPSSILQKTSRRGIQNKSHTVDKSHSVSHDALQDKDTLRHLPSKKPRELETPQGPKGTRSTVNFINWHSAPRVQKKVGARENFVKLNMKRGGGRSHRFINMASRRKLGAGKYKFKRYGKRKAKKSPGSHEEDAADCDAKANFNMDGELLQQESEGLLQNAESSEGVLHDGEKVNALTSAAAEARQTPTEQNLQTVLHLLLGHKSFRPGQLETIGNVLAGKSTMLVLPTGAGKSLTYQLPSFLLPGLTLVVSPLVSVMVDQAQHLPPFLPGAVLSSMQTVKEYCSILDRLHAGRVKVLFVSPERLLCEKFIAALQGLSFISLAVVDEAHCLSEWSHNFRSSYHRLGVILRQRLNIGCVLALTATATKRTLNSIMQTLSIAPANLMQLSVIRKNLICTASLSDNRCKDLLSLLLSSPYKDARSMIIYCNFQFEADNVSMVLRDNGIDAKSYHGGMNPADRKRTQELFCTNKIRVIVATVAFGLGLDKSDVSAVLHYGLPSSVEQYVQETGRAGRNGDSAHCHLLLDNMNYLKLRSLAFSDNVDISAIQGLLSMIFSDASDKNSSCQIQCISIESGTKNLDLKEEILTTALSYLEVGDVQYVSMLPTIKTTCTMQFHKSTPNLLARNSLLIDAVMKRSREKNGEFFFELPSVANYMGLKLADLQQQLQELQSAGEISFNVKNPSLCFQVLREPENLGALALRIFERFALMEDLKVKKLDFMFHTATGLTIKGRSSSDVQSLLQERIQYYFESEGEEGIDCKPPNIVKYSSSSPFLKADIKVFLQNNSSSSFTSRAIARIFHGLPSPAYPSNIWSQNHFWGRYKDTDFNTIKEAASQILKA